MKKEPNPPVFKPYKLVIEDDTDHQAIIDGLGLLIVNSSSMAERDWLRALIKMLKSDQ